MASIKCVNCGANTRIRARNYMGTCQCSGCGKILGVKMSEGIVQQVFLAEYAVLFPANVPKDVRDDFDEAVRCFNVRAYKASVTMCRRAVEVLADLKGARGNLIFEKLLDLKNRRILDQAAYNVASGVRQFGGYGAHPQKDLLRDVDRGVADLVLRVAERLIREICHHHHS